MLELNKETIAADSRFTICGPITLHEMSQACVGLYSISGLFDIRRGGVVTGHSRKNHIGPVLVLWPLKCVDLNFDLNE